MTVGRWSAPPGRPRKPLILLSMQIGVSMPCLPVGGYEDVDCTLSLLSVSPRETQRKVVYQVLPRLSEDRECWVCMLRSPRCKGYRLRRSSGMMGDNPQSLDSTQLYGGEAVTFDGVLEQALEMLERCG